MAKLTNPLDHLIPPAPGSLAAGYADLTRTPGDPLDLYLRSHSALQSTWSSNGFTAWLRDHAEPFLHDTTVTIEYVADALGGITLGTLLAAQAGLITNMKGESAFEAHHLYWGFLIEKVADLAERYIESPVWRVCLDVVRFMGSLIETDDFINHDILGLMFGKNDSSPLHMLYVDDMRPYLAGFFQFMQLHFGITIAF